MIRTFLSALLLAAAFASPAKAEAQRYTFDKLHTQIFFSVEHMGFSHSIGRFLKFDGGFVFDQAAPANTTVDATIDTTSLDMGDATWKEHLSAEGFFNTAKYPSMTFKSTKVDVIDKETATLTGDLTLLGVTKPVTLAVSLNSCGIHPMSKLPTCGFTAMGMLKRSDWGMTQYIPMVGDEVELRIEVEASTQKEAGK